MYFCEKEVEKTISPPMPTEALMSIVGVTITPGARGIPGTKYKVSRWSDLELAFISPLMEKLAEKFNIGLKVKCRKIEGVMPRLMGFVEREMNLK